MARIYVTKWVIARGILVTDVEKPKRTDHSIYEYAKVQIPGMRASYPVRMGREAFFTLAEAREEARWQFEQRHRRLQREMNHVRLALLKFKGKKSVRVHTNIENIRTCRAF